MSIKSLLPTAMGRRVDVDRVSCRSQLGDSLEITLNEIQPARSRCRFRKKNLTTGIGWWAMEVL
jgi:hypothetical protein